jgi:hypothetical protein
MLFPLIHLATAYNRSQPANPSAPSLYDPPSDLVADAVNTRTHVLHADGDVKISRELKWDNLDPENPQIVSNRLIVETGNDADHIHVRTWPGAELRIFINGKAYGFDADVEQGPQQTLWVHCNGGDDQVIVDDDVVIDVSVFAGDGDDSIRAGGGRSRLYGERGNDRLRLGSGLGYASGGDGDDDTHGGTGNAVMYGNRGNDRIQAGLGPATQQSYVDGGDGKDVLLAGNGHTVLHGGNDDDHLVARGRTTLYTGKGNDLIENNQRGDRIYAGPADRFDRTQGSAVTEVTPSDAGEQGFSVQGDEAFKQQVADDFEFLRSSPIGQQALAQMDELARANGGKVTLEPIGLGETSYVYGSAALDNLVTGTDPHIERSDLGEIVDGVAGSRADRATIYYDPASIVESADRTNTVVPVTGLFHEIAHAYNGATGTFLQGSSIEVLASGRWNVVKHEEQQVIGLPSRATPFDFDNDPSTPPSTINPKPFTENALNEEMDKPLRQTYALGTSDQGQG